MKESRHRRGRRAARVVAVAGAFAFAIGGVGLVDSSRPAAADDAPGSGFQSLSLSAVAGGQRVIADELAGQSPGTADTGVPDAEASMTASTSHALSSVAWPSALVGNAGSLLFLLGPFPCSPGEVLPVVGAIQPHCSPVPIPDAVMQQYHYLNSPIRAEAQYPTHPDANTSLPGAVMTARAGNIETAADAVLGTAFTSDIAKLASLRAASVVKLTGAATALADAHSTVSDIDLAGGEVTIGAVASTAHCETSGARATSTGATTITDLKVHGIPVTVDGTGVHVNGHNGDTTAATNQVASALQQLGMKMFLTAPVQSTHDGVATFDAGSLVIEWLPQGAPGRVVFEFGGAHATAAASLPFVFEFPATGVIDAGVTLPVDLGTVSPFVDTTVGAVGATRSRTPGVSIATQSASAHVPLPKGLASWWIIVGLAAVAAFGAALFRLPSRVLDAPVTTCRDGGQR